MAHFQGLGLHVPGVVFIHEHDNGPGLSPSAELVDDFVEVLLLGCPADLGRDCDADALLLGEVDERGNPFLAVLALRGHSAHVPPAHDLGDLDHGLGLKVVGRDDAGEVLETGLVAQLSRGRRVADLRNLE